MEAFDNIVKKHTTWFDNEYVAGALTIFLIVYASMAAPKLPNYVAKLFDYTLFKLLMFFLIVYISKRNATVALVAAIALMVSIMTLDRLKFGKEMMEVVGGESRRKLRMGNCVCDCGNVVDVEEKVAVLQSEEAKIVVAEVKKAEANGLLQPADAELLLTKLVVAEEKGLPILVATTEEGAKRMEAIAHAVSEGVFGEQEAKKLAANVLVQEVIVSHTLQPKESVSMEGLAQEVLRIKQEETERRGGSAPSGEELRQICANVLKEYKYSSKCGSDCMSASSSEVSGNDADASSYSPVEQK